MACSDHLKPLHALAGLLDGGSSSQLGARSTQELDEGPDGFRSSARSLASRRKPAPAPPSVFDSAFHSFLTTPGTPSSEDWAHEFASGAESDQHSDDASVSPLWNPEHLSLLARSRSASSSSSLFSYPTPDDAHANSPCGSPAPSVADSRSCSRDGGHTPLTFDPPAHAAWDHERLFSGRRRWYGGVRVPGEFLAPAAAEEPEGDDGDGQQDEGWARAAALAHLEHAERRRRSPLAGRSPPGAERSRGRSALCEEVTGVAEGEEARARRVHARLREQAKARMGLVLGHLGADGGAGSQSGFAELARSLGGEGGA